MGFPQSPTRACISFQAILLALFSVYLDLVDVSYRWCSSSSEEVDQQRRDAGGYEDNCLPRQQQYPPLQPEGVRG